MGVTSVTADTEKSVTFFTTNPRRIVTHVTTNLGEVDTPVVAESTVITQNPLYPQRLTKIGMTSLPESNFLRELQNLHIQIPLLQALKEVPIYVKTVLDLCIKKPGRKPKDPTTIHVMGKLSELMYARPLLTKYNDPGNPTVTAYINDQPITNTLIDLGMPLM